MRHVVNDSARGARPAGPPGDRAAPATADLSPVRRSPAWDTGGARSVRHPGHVARASAPSRPATFSRAIAVGRGADVFEAAAERLMTWQVHRDAGLRVTADHDRAVPGAQVVLRLRLGPLVVPAPCVVIGVVAEEHERGFSYRTLPGHPERGVEHFRVCIGPDGSVRGHVQAESVPASLLARAGGPVTSVVQTWQTDRYLKALRPSG